MNKTFKTKIGKIKLTEFRTPTTLSYWILFPKKGIVLEKNEMKELKKILNKMKD